MRIVGIDGEEKAKFMRIMKKLDRVELEHIREARKRAK